MRRLFARAAVRRGLAFCAGAALMIAGNLGGRGSLGGFLAFVPGLMAMALILPRGRLPAGRELGLSALAGGLTAAASLGLLLGLGCIRFPHAREIFSPGAAARLIAEALTQLYIAALLRASLMAAIPGRAMRYAVSALAEAGLMLLAFGGWNLTLAVNGCLAGLMMAQLYERTGGALCEAVGVFAFRAVSRFGFGFPDLGGAYPVSEGWLTGEYAGGLEGSGIILIVLLAALTAGIFLKKRPIGTKR